MKHSTTSAATHDDPLAPVSARFSTGRADRDSLASVEAPSGASTRPFSLRFAVVAAAVEVSLPPGRYCENRQMMMTTGDDGAGVPLHTMMPSRTTVGSKDGGKSPMEDWTPDAMLDATP